MSSLLAVAELSSAPPWGDVLFFMGLGFVMVMIVLLTLAGIIALQGILFARYAVKMSGRPGAPSPAPQSSPAPAATPAAAPVASGPESVSMPGPVEPEILAVIAAAVSCVLDQPHRILAVKPAPTMQHWSIEGRRQIFASHKVR